MSTVSYLTDGYVHIYASTKKRPFAARYLSSYERFTNYNKAHIFISLSTFPDGELSAFGCTLTSATGVTYFVCDKMHIRKKAPAVGTRVNMSAG